MEITFPRLPDGRRAYSVIRRADGVRYRVHQGIAGPRIPHDLTHLVVERATGDDGGFWGAVAAGAVFSSMEHLDGRRPPHVADRSAAAIRRRAGTLQRAELMGELVERVAEQGISTAREVRQLAREALATLQDDRVDEQRVLAAAGELRRTAEHWANLSPGDELTVDWPEPRR